MRKVSFICALFLVGGVGIFSVPGDEETMLLEPVVFMAINE